MSIDWNISKHKSIPSTQDYLKYVLSDTPHLPEGYGVHALSQNNGHGRHGRVWEQGTGNLYLSFLVRPNCSPDKIGQIALLTGLAVSQVIDTYIEGAASIVKWPNDVLINNKKCAGIIIDAAAVESDNVDYIILGVGVNLAVAPLDDVSNVQAYSSENIDMDIFRDRLLAHFSMLYGQWKKVGFDALRAQWLDKTFDVGTYIGVKINEKHVEGRFETIDKLGNLVLICVQSGEQRKITSGDVFLL